MTGAIAFLPVRLDRPVIYTPPGRRHVRQTVSKQNCRYRRHVSVRPRNVPCPIGLVASLSDKIEATFAPGRLDPSICNPRGRTIGAFLLIGPDGIFLTI